MPRVFDVIARYRNDWGVEHVAECIRRGLAGEPGWFYAFEAGHVVGTPFVADKALMDVLNLGLVIGGRYAVAMRPPAQGSNTQGVAHGA